METRNQGPLTNAAKRRFTTKQLGLKVLKGMDKNSDVGTNLQIPSKPQWFWFVLCTCVYSLLLQMRSGLFGDILRTDYRKKSIVQIRRIDTYNQGDLFTVSCQTAYILPNMFLLLISQDWYGNEKRSLIWSFGRIFANAGGYQSKTFATEFGRFLRWCRILTCHMTQMNFHCLDLKWWGMGWSAIQVIAMVRWLSWLLAFNAW